MGPITCCTLAWAPGAAGHPRPRQPAQWACGGLRSPSGRAAAAACTRAQSLGRDTGQWRGGTRPG
eukprot:scaffold6667_cov111-Isochrysis_galbana.AAC.4